MKGIMTKKEAFEFGAAELASTLAKIEYFKDRYVRSGSLLEHDLDKALSHIYNAQFALHEKDAIEIRGRKTKHGSTR